MCHGSVARGINFMKIMLIILGFLALGLGAVGLVIPVLPTTPFLLVSTFCFARSSERLNTWFKGTKLYKIIWRHLFGARE